MVAAASKLHVEALVAERLGKRAPWPQRDGGLRQAFDLAAFDADEMRMLVLVRRPRGTLEAPEVVAEVALGRQSCIDEIDEIAIDGGAVEAVIRNGHVDLGMGEGRRGVVEATQDGEASRRRAQTMSSQLPAGSFAIVTTLFGATGHEWRIPGSPSYRNRNAGASQLQ